MMTFLHIATQKCRCHHDQELLYKDVQTIIYKKHYRICCYGKKLFVIQ